MTTTLDRDFAVAPRVATGATLVPAGRQVRSWPERFRATNDAMWHADEATAHDKGELVIRRLVAIEAALFEELGCRLQPESRTCVVRLLASCPAIRIPSISAQPDGVLVCTWKKGNGERLAIRCVGGSDMHFSYIGPNVPVGQVRLHEFGNIDKPAAFWDENDRARRVAA